MKYLLGSTRLQFKDIDLWEDRNQRLELISKSINYINSVHTIPPLKGNYAWFEYTLLALLEIAEPQSGIMKNTPAFEFLFDMQKGIKESIEDANKNIDE